MDFPVYQTPFFGNGMVIGFNAIVHVLISHGFAIGAFAMLTLFEIAPRAGWVDAGVERWSGFNKRFLRFTVVITTTLGAVTGAGIWFTTTSLAPRALGSIVRLFFWPWFTEFWIFVAEVVGVLALYAGWDRLGTKVRIRLLGAYVAFAAVSAVLITGILGYMLTPSTFPSPDRLVRAFFNPTFLPQLVVRLSISMALGSVFAALYGLFAGPKEPAFRRSLTRLCAPVLLISSVTLAAGLFYYYLAVPPTFTTRSVFSVLTSHLTQHPEVFVFGNAFAFLVLLSAGIVAFSRRDGAKRAMFAAALLAAVAVTAQFERIREFIRGPYLLPGYMYVNQVLLQEEPLAREQGLLTRSHWFGRGPYRATAAQKGGFAFASNCSACHTATGINGVQRRFSGRSRASTEVLVGRIHEMASFMPPFVGTDEERQLAAQFAYDWTNGHVRLESEGRFVVGFGDTPSPRSKPDERATRLLEEAAEPWRSLETK